MKTDKIANFGLLIALAFILSYIESLFPIPFPVPGIKLGLANLVVIIALYKLGSKEAFVLSVLRIILISFTFGNLYMLMFSMTGGLLSWLLMSIAKKSKLFSMVGVSVIGGVSHNIGQIIMAVIVVENINIAYYLPFLLVSGITAGIIIGIVASIIISRFKKQ